jgi:hypothetical protein
MNTERNATLTFTDGTSREIKCVGYGVPQDQPYFIGFLLADKTELLFNQDKLVSIELSPPAAPYKLIVPDTKLVTQ